MFLGVLGVGRLLLSLEGDVPVIGAVFKRDFVLSIADSVIYGPFN